MNSISNPPPAEARPLDFALWYASLGLAVFPLRPDTKVPAYSGWQREATADTHRIREWWGNTDFNVGVRTGDGLVVLDIDTKNGKPGNASFEVLHLSPQETFGVRTCSGGAHLYYQHTEEVSSSVERIGEGLDIKAAGGYVVGAGSVLGSKRYSVGSNAPIAPLPPVLIERIGRRPLKPERGAEPAAPLDQPESIDRAIAYLLKDAPVAVEGHGGDHTTYTVACRLKDFGLSAFMVWDLLAEHWNPRCSPPWEPDDLERKVNNAFAYGQNAPGSEHPEAQFSGVGLSEHQRETDGFGNSGTWDEPDLTLLTNWVPSAPPFPQSVLGPLAEWCATAAEAKNCPYDYVAAALLTVTGASIGNAREVVLGHDWSQPPLLWTALVGPPSSGKSPALDPFSKALGEIEHEWHSIFELTLRQHEGKLQRAKAARTRWEQAIKDGRPDVESVLPVEAIIQETPRAPRLVIADSTIEAVATMAAANPRGLLMKRDELAGWVRAMDRYSGDRGGDVQFWLEAYGARSYTVDRKTSGAIRIPRLAVSVIGGVQPDVLTKFLLRESDGLTARFLWVYPDNAAKFKLARDPLDHGLLARALKALVALRGEETGAGWRPVVCRVESPAASIFEQWWSNCLAKQVELRGPYADWMGKAGGLVLRVALILEHLWWAGPLAKAETAEIAKLPPIAISRRAIESAIRLIDDWAAPMAWRTAGAANASDADSDAAALAKLIARTGMRNFNARSLRRSPGLGGKLATAPGMRAACDVLEERGILRRLVQGGGPGRKALDYEVNPIALSAGAAQ